MRPRRAFYVLTVGMLLFLAAPAPSTAAVPTTILNESSIGISHVDRSYSPSSKATLAGSYITWRATMSPSASGERVEIWMATKPGSSWTAFRKVTTRLVDTAGNAYFWYRSPWGQWVAVRFVFTGNSSHGRTTSPTRFARYIEVLDRTVAAMTVVPGVRVRSKPRISADSIKYLPLLPEGTTLRIVSGPVFGSGYWWYLVDLAPGTLHGGITRGWVAAGGRDGTTWVQNVPIDEG